MSSQLAGTLPEHLQTVGDTEVIYRQLSGAAPKLELAIAYRQDNFSPIVQQFLYIVEEQIQESVRESVA